MNVILPIHKKWIEKILRGEKRAELRKTRLRQSPVECIVYLYETAPTSAVVGYAECFAYTSEIVKSCDEVMRTVYGMTRDEVTEIFGDRENIWVVWMKNPRRFEAPIPIERFTGKRFAPQSHIYTDINPSELGVRAHDVREWK